MNVYGIFHLKAKNTTTHKISPNHRIISKIYLLDILIDYLKNDFKSKIFTIYFVNTIKRKQIKLLNGKQKLLFKYVIEKIIKCKYISKNNKSQIKQKYSLINF